MKISNKKSQTGLLYLPTAAFIIALILFFMSSAPKIDGFIGQKQSAVLRAVGQGEQELAFIDSSAKLAAWVSLYDLGDRGGLYSEEGDDGERALESYPCKKFVYNLWYSQEEKDCWPNATMVKESYSNHFDQNLKQEFLEQHPLSRFKNTNYQYEVMIDSENKTTTIRGLSEFNVPIIISSLTATLLEDKGYKTNKEAEIKFEESGDFQENIIKCCDGKCVVNIAEKYYQEYGPDGLELPYVWGGVTPYNVEQTIKDWDNGKNTESFFHGTYIHYPDQPSGNKRRSGQATIPGFDCSGFVWWVYKHAGLKDFYNKKSSRELEEYAKEKVSKKVTGYDIICGLDPLTCTKEAFEKGNAQPGDLIFKYNDLNKAVTHVAIYIGNNQIIDSSGDHNGIGKRLTVPSNWFGHMTVYRFPYNTKCEQPQPMQQTTTSTTEKTKSSIDTSSLKLGSLSEKYESGIRGSSAIGYDTTGKTSYGKYQISSYTMKGFLDYLKSTSPDLYLRLKEAGNPNCEIPCGGPGASRSCLIGCEFAKVWKEEAEKGSFDNDLEQGFIKKTHYDPAITGVMSKCEGLDINQKSFALQNVLWSTAVQHGPTGASNLFKTAGVNEDDSDKEIINKVYDERSKVDKYFSQSTSAIKQSVLKRFADERKLALSWLEQGVESPLPIPGGPSIILSEETIGKYYVHPSFAVEVNYDLSVYDDLVKWAKVTYDECSGTEKNMYKCIDEEKEKHNIEFNKTPEKIKFKFEEFEFCDEEYKDNYEFIEILESCIEFGDENCYCEFPSYLYPDLELTSESVKLLGSARTFEYYDFPEDLNISFTHKGEIVDKIKLHSEGDYIFSEYSGQNHYDTIKQTSYYLIKKEDIFEDYVDDKKSLSQGKCDLESPKHKFRFCVSTPSKIPIYTQESESVSFEQVPIKFALDLHNQPPPALAPGSEDSYVSGQGDSEKVSKEKECKGVSNVDIKFKVTTPELKSSYEGFITDIVGTVSPQIKLILFLKNLLSLKDFVPALVTAEVKLNTNDPECDITGIAYKCGLVKPMKDGKFDFSNPSGIISVGNHYQTKSTLSCTEKGCFNFNDKNIDCYTPNINDGSFALTLSKCDDPISQFKKLDGVDVITAALSGFKYYFAFAYVDGADNIGPAKIYYVEIPSVMDKLKVDLGIIPAEIDFINKMLNGNYESIFGMLGIPNAFSMFQSAISSASLDTLMGNLHDSAKTELFKTLEDNMDIGGAKQILDYYEQYKDMRPDGLLDAMVDKLDVSDYEKMFNDAKTKGMKEFGTFFDKLPLETKKDVIRKACQECLRRQMSGITASVIGPSLDNAEEKCKKEYLAEPKKAIELVKALPDEYKNKFGVQMIKKYPDQMMSFVRNSIPEAKQLDALKDYMATATDEQKRLMALASPDALKKKLLDNVLNQIPAFSDPMKIFEEFRDYDVCK